MKRTARNLVLLLSDMKGFTARTSAQTRDENARMLALHDALLLPIVRGYRGEKVKGLGDALLAAFLSPTDAVLCATAMQDRLAAWNAGADPGDRIEVRIAVSQGEVRRSRGDLHGEAMQLAVEAEARADAGEVVLTDAVYLSMNKSEAPTEIVGEVPLSGGGRIRLRRALRGQDALAPYGGRALSRLGRLPDPARAIRLRMAVDRTLDFARKRAVWAAAGLVLIAAAAGEKELRPPMDPVARAAEMVERRQPLAALSQLDVLADSPRATDAAVQVIRGKAEHALGQMGPAFSDFAAAARQDPPRHRPGRHRRAGGPARRGDLSRGLAPRAHPAPGRAHRQAGRAGGAQAALVATGGIARGRADGARACGRRHRRGPPDQRASQSRRRARVLPRAQGGGAKARAGGRRSGRSAALARGGRADVRVRRGARCAPPQEAVPARGGALRVEAQPERLPPASNPSTPSVVPARPRKSTG